MAFLNQGSDLVWDQGIEYALSATKGPGWRLSGFGLASGGCSKYNTGSHVDVQGASMLVGLTLGNEAPMGRATIGLFLEGGWGSYDSHNSFSNFASVKGTGDTSYMGGGILARYDINSGRFSGLYLNGSARMGRAKTDFGTDDILYSGLKAKFDSSSLYYGFHGGFGYVWDVNDKANLDFSAKAIWTRQEGDSESVHGDRLRFRNSDSIRTRMGARFNYTVSEFFTPYAGVWWDREFDGEIESTVNGHRIDAPTLKGDSSVGEIGVNFRLIGDSKLSLDFGVQGYAGVREGVSGTVRLKYEF